MIRRLIHKIMCHFGHHEFGLTFWHTQLSFHGKGKTEYFKKCFWCNAEIVDEKCEKLNKLDEDIRKLDFSTMTTTNTKIVKKNIKGLE